MFKEQCPCSGRKNVTANHKAATDRQYQIGTRYVGINGNEKDATYWGRTLMNPTLRLSSGLFCLLLVIGIPMADAQPTIVSAGHDSSVTKRTARGVIDRYLNNWNANEPNQLAASPRQSGATDRRGNARSTFDVITFFNTSETVDSWDSNAHAWIGVRRDTSTYDIKGHLTWHMSQMWSEGGWVNSSQEIYTINAWGDQIEWMAQHWAESLWVNDVRSVDTYLSPGNRTETVLFQWNGSVWANKFRRTYAYDGYGNQTECLTESWQSGAWVNYTKLHSTYQSYGKETEGLLQIWMDSGWVNQTRVVNTFNSHEFTTASVSQTWGDTSGWDNSSQHIYSYDEHDNCTMDSGLVAVGSVWVNSSRHLFTYNGMWQQLTELFQRWDGAQWRDSSLSTPISDALGNWTVRTVQIWNNTVWQDSRRITYTWIGLDTPVREARDDQTTYRLSNNFPNPFNPSTTISFSVPKQSHISLRLFDVIGREVASLLDETKPVGSYAVDFDASNLPSGVYFYRLHAGEFVETKKMLVMR